MQEKCITKFKLNIDTRFDFVGKKNTLLFTKQGVNFKYRVDSSNKK